MYLEDGVVPRSSRDDNHNRLGEDASRYLVVRPGDLVFNKLRTWQGGLGVSHHEGIVSPAYYVCRPRSSIEPRFLHYLLRSRQYLAELTRVSKFMPPSQFDILWEDLRNISIVYPSLIEQQAIADYLDIETARVDALITEKYRLIDLVRERAERVVDGIALPHGRPSERLTPSDLPSEGEVPDHWRIEALGTILRRITYGFTNPMPTSDVGPLMLTANDIGDGLIHHGTARRTTQDAFDSLLTSKSRPKRGDILLTKDGTLGRVALFDGPDACVNQSVAVLTPDRTRVLPELLAELLAVPAYREALIFEAGGTTIKHLYITRVVKQKVALPPISEQSALAAELRGARSTHSEAAMTIEASIRVLREHRQALITAVVAGDRRNSGVL